jgi:hypothetical protein
MTLRSYIWVMRLMTLISAVALAFFVVRVNPEAPGFWAKPIFFLLIFLVLGGFFNLILLRLRKGMMDLETELSNTSLSFRQGALLALFACGLLILQGFRILIWWDALLLLAGVFLIELYFLSRN